MGQYNKAVLTTAGENLIARALAGEIKLNITKAKTSDFAYPNNKDFKRLTDMQGVRQTVCDPETVAFNETIIQTRVLFSNEDIASTYYIHNIGLYAMDGTHEVLFSIVIAEMPDEMPQYNGVASTSYIYNIQNVVQDAAQLNIFVNPSGTATIQDVLERVDAIGGDISETVIETLDTVEDKYPVPAAGESVKRFLGKVLTFLRNIRPLTSNIILYVSTTGSDTTGDGTAARPFKAIQHAIDIIPKDLRGYSAIINVANGTYNEDIRILGFYGGEIYIRTSTPTTLSQNTKINTKYVKNCNAYVSVEGFQLLGTQDMTAISIFCTHVHFEALTLATTPATGIGIFIAETNLARIYNCNVNGRNHAVRFNNSSGYITSCSGTSNNIGMYASSASIVHVSGTVISATTQLGQENGGVFINSTGTQISSDITYGLSCAWGAIETGYVRNGNYNSNGSAEIIVNMRVRPTIALTSGTKYTISGLPSIATGFSSVAVAVDTPANVRQCFIYANGTLEFTPSINIALGTWNIAFSATYITYI